MGVIVGIDKFMSEARAVTNFTGNAVATLLIGRWTREIDREQVKLVLSGQSPFDEASLNGDGHDTTPTGELDAIVADQQAEQQPEPSRR